jgi:hypothetical protein
MKVFIIAALAATGLFAIATYRPVQICETVQTHAEVHCDDNCCTTTTSQPTFVCHQSHE